MFFFPYILPLLAVYVPIVPYIAAVLKAQLKRPVSIQVVFFNCVFLVPIILLYELLYYGLYRPEVNGKWFKVHELNINLGYVQPLSLRAAEHAIQNAAL